MELVHFVHSRFAMLTFFSFFVFSFTLLLPKQSILFLPTIFLPYLTLTYIPFSRQSAVQPIPFVLQYNLSNYSLLYPTKPFLLKEMYFI
jgi:hypothetical protein